MNRTDFIDRYTNLIKQNKNPIVSVDATHGEVFVPRDCIDEEGMIHLNLSPKAVCHLKVMNDAVYCRASFNSKVFCISFPLANILEMSSATESI